MKYDFDLIVIGAGSGGVRASRIAAKHGARVAVIENSALGGTCVNVGCVPKKLFAIGAHYADELKNAKGYGWQVPHVHFDWDTLRENKNKEIARLNKIYEKLLLDAGVDIIHGSAYFVDPHTIAVDTKQYTAAFILIACGAEAFVPDIPGKEYAITSTQAFFLKELPKRATVVGGGYIALEFASIFNGLGVETTLLHRDALLLRGFDEDIRSFAGQEITKKGITLQLNSSIQKIEKNFHITLNDNTVHATDIILFATGRRPHTQPLQLQNAHISVQDNGSIAVNESYQTTVPHIYAVGDVIGGPQLTPLAIAQGHVVADNLFAKMDRRLNTQLIPSAVFCDPNIGTVGLTENEARAQYKEVQIFKTNFRPLKHTLTGSDEKVFMKLIVDKTSDRILGIHMVGSEAGELIQGFATAMTAGATKKDFDNTLAIHPTSAEEFVLMR